MHRTPPRFLTVALLVLLPLAGVACGSSSGGGGGASPGHVNVVDNRFDPGTIEVAIGDTVTWEFKGAVKHNVTGPGFNSPTQKSGMYEHTFNSAGTFKYVCTIHAGMKGTVKVS
jgi:plastocyanin